MASLKPEKLENVQKGPTLEPHLAHSGQELLEPLTLCESKRYFVRKGLDRNPDIGYHFHFYHPGLGPGNIMDANHKVSAIIDWEAAGFYPRLWISTKPSVSSELDFHPLISGVEDLEWRRRLRIRLEEHGYPRFAEWFIEWRKTTAKIVV